MKYPGRKVRTQYILNNMVKTKIKTTVRGKIHIKIYDKATGKLVREIEKHNDIQAIANQALVQSLIGYAPAMLQSISLYSGGSLLATENFIETDPDGDFIIVSSVFGTDDFNGSFDEARLNTAGIGEFSIVTGLDGFKDDTQTAIFTWTIEVDLCEED